MFNIVLQIKMTKLSPNIFDNFSGVWKDKALAKRCLTILGKTLAKNFLTIVVVFGRKTRQDIFDDCSAVWKDKTLTKKSSGV